MPASVAALVEAAPAVAWVQEDRAVSTTAQTTPTGINRANADASPTAKVNGADERVDVDVAVIDTGVDLTHPDINVYRAGAKNCSIGAVNAFAFSRGASIDEMAYVWRDLPGEVEQVHGFLRSARGRLVAPAPPDPIQRVAAREVLDVCQPLPMIETAGTRGATAGTSRFRLFASRWRRRRTVKSRCLRRRP